MHESNLEHIETATAGSIQKAMDRRAEHALCAIPVAPNDNFAMAKSCEFD